MTIHSVKDEKRILAADLMESYITGIKTGYVDDFRFERAYEDRFEMQWHFADTEFLLTHHTLPGREGSVMWRFRFQKLKENTPPTDNWIDVHTWKEARDIMRQAKGRKVYTKAREKSIEGMAVHQGTIPGEQVILLGYSGSHAYGLNHNGWTEPDGTIIPPSDVDLRGVFVVPTREVLSLGRHKELVEQKDTDTKIDEVERFLELCLKCNPERLEMLGCQKREKVTPEGQMLIDIQRSFLSKRVRKTYGGYAKGQIGRVERKIERSTKPLMHLIRLMLTGTFILREGYVNPDMSTYRDELMAIRKGEMSEEDALKWFYVLEAEFNKAGETTKLPDEPDWEKANQVLLEIRRNNLQW